MEKFHPLDIVALLADAPEHGLRRGAVGTVIEVFEQNEHHPGGYLIEFVNETGQTLAELAVTDTRQLIPLQFKLRAA